MILDEKYKYPWANATWAILQIEPNFSEIIKENGWERPYIHKLSDDDIDERKIAAEVLGKMGTEIALTFLKEIYGDYEKRRGMGDELFYAIRDIEERVNR